MPVRTPLLLLCLGLLAQLPAVAAAAGAAAPYRVLSGDTIFAEGTSWRPIDDDGVFYCSSKLRPGHPMPRIRETVADIIKYNGFQGIVECVPAAYIDCTRTDGGFEDDGKSRVLGLGGTGFRVTGTGPDTSWFSYVFDIPGLRAGDPYLFVAELINDRERYNSFAFTVPRGATWAVPYKGAEGKLPGFGDTFNPDNFRPDVSGGTYGGRECPVDGRPYNYTCLVYPKAGRLKVTVSHKEDELEADEANGAAVSRMWLFKIAEPLEDNAVEVTAPGGARQRRIGVYCTHPWYFYAHYGVPARKREDRVASLERLVDYLAFCGMNHIEFNAVNGTDRTKAAWYDSELFGNLIGDLMDELLPICDRAGFSAVPAIASLTLPGMGEMSTPLSDNPDKYGLSRLSFQIDRDGESVVQFFGAERAPDPQRPEVQDFFISIMKELATRSKAHPSVMGLGFRVNGKHGFCYCGDFDRNGHHSGYSEWNIAQFEKEAGIDVRGDGAEAARWLRENAWDEWLDWRCRVMREFWLRARDEVRRVDPRLALIAKTDLPSEVPGTTTLFAQGVDPHTLIKYHGVDPRLFAGDDGIWVQRVMMIGANRYFGKWGPPFGGPDAAGLRQFHLEPAVAGLYGTGEGSSVELYYNYFEQGTDAAPHPDMEFGMFRTFTLTPLGRNFLEHACFALRHDNAHVIAMLGWERPTMGNETQLRRWCRAFRAIPSTDAREFEGVVEPGTPGIWVRRFADRIAVMNDGRAPSWARLSIPVDDVHYARVVDLSTGESLKTDLSEDGGSLVVRVDLLAFDLRALEVTAMDPAGGVLPPPPPPGG